MQKLLLALAKFKKIGAIKIGFAALMLLAFLVMGSSALALEIKYPTLPGGITLSEKSQFNEFVRYIYAFSIGITGFLALGIAIFGGLLYFLSRGNPAKTAEAKEWIGAGFWGILILLMAYIILVTINPQLVGLKEISFAPTAVPQYNPSARTPLQEQKDIAFQIPMGKIIEQAILDSPDTKTQFSWITTENDTQLRQETKKIIQGVIDDTNQLNPDVLELKKLIDSCNNCGISQCSGNCAPQNCQINCDFSAIRGKADQIKNSPLLRGLEEKEGRLAELRGEIARRASNLYRAIFLTTIFFDEVRDYFSFAIERAAVAKDNKVEIETLPEWQDIKLAIKTKDGRTIPDPATFYFWKRYQEMENAINFAENGIGGDYTLSYPGTTIPPGVVCVPGQPGAMVWPAQGTVTTYFGDPGPWQTGYHMGIDITNSLGTPVVAAAAGKVIAVNTGCVPRNTACGDKYGNWILIEHENFDQSVGTIYTLYANLDTVLVTPGGNVSQGQQIGTMGWTGWTEPSSEAGTRLHFEVRKNRDDNQIDPMTYLTGNSVCGPGGAGGGGTCEIITDPNNACSVEKLRPYFGARAEEASQICNAESGGNVWNLNSGCQRGAYDYSVGLFQINLYRTRRCDAVGIPEAQIFEEISPSTCRIKNQSLANECAKKYGWGNSDLNAQKAVQIYNARGNWCDWSTACPLYCNLCSSWSSCP